MSNFTNLMIPAKKNNIIGFLFSVYHNRLLKKHFYRVHLRGGENYGRIDPELPTILYANHSNWWDGFIAYYLSSKIWKVNDYLMMDIEQMKKYPFFKFVGVFSVNRKSAKEALESIDYAAALLKNTKNFMWIFPQGEMHPQDKRPLIFYSGITKLAEKTGRVNLLPVALRYEFRMEQRPEVFITLGMPDNLDQELSGTKDYTGYLLEKLTAELDMLQRDVTGNNTTGFEVIFHGKDSRNKTFDNIVD
jgi:1-acyl-sn-glycerol-3-phosphate acyltransferase